MHCVQTPRTAPSRAHVILDILEMAHLAQVNSFSHFQKVLYIGVAITIKTHIGFDSGIIYILKL